MKEKNTFLILMASFLLLAGCKEEKVYDVQYYLDHPEERKIQIEKCRNNPGELESTPNCKNAFTAEVRRSFTGTQGIELPVLKFKK